MLCPECLASQQAGLGREGVRKPDMEAAITMAPPGCLEAEITSDFKVRGSNTASVAIVTGRCMCECVCANSIGGLLCMIHTVTSPDGITVLLLIYSQKLPVFLKHPYICTHEHVWEDMLGCIYTQNTHPHTRARPISQWDSNFMLCPLKIIFPLIIFEKV